jgi:hypothetical protein
MNPWTDMVVKGGTQKVLQPRIVLYAPAGVGKSTFGSRLPKPIFIDFDRGVDDVNVDRIPGPKTWADALSIIRSIAAAPGDYKSLVIDTVDPLEEMAIDHVAMEAGKTFAKMNDDYGSGYIAVAMAWKLFLAELDAARKNGLLVCLLGHAIVRQASDPTLGSFDQFTSQLGKKTWALTQRWADLVGFAQFDSALVDKKDEQRVIVTGKRVLHTTRGSGFEAKNRFSLSSRIDLSWDALSKGIEAHRRNAEVTEASILALAEKVGGDAPEKARAYVKDANKDLTTLFAIEAALKEKLAAPPVVITKAAPELTSTVLSGAAKVMSLMADGASKESTVVGPIADEAIARSSPEAIEGRILALAGKVGGDAPTRATKYIAEANKDLVSLLQIEEALTKKLKAVEANGGAVT